MDLDLTPEQRAFRDEVRTFIREKLPSEIRERLRAGHPPRKQDTVAWQRILNERGWAAPHWPKRYGGADLGPMERLILLDEAYRAPAPLPQVFNVGMLGPVLMKFGTPAQCDHFLPRLANLDIWFCQGFSEPGSGSDLASLRTAARREGDHYIVNGQKIWTTTAHLADWVFALVRTDTEARKQEGISFLLIDLRTPGITIRPIHSIDGEHHLNEVFFDEVRVPVGNLVGQENKGWDYAKFLLGNERTSAAPVGSIKAVLAQAKQHARETRSPNGTALDDPLLAARFAELEAEVMALELTVLRVAGDSRDGRPDPASSILKLRGSELQQEVFELMVDVAGVEALTWHTGDWGGETLPRYLNFRKASIYSGSNEVQRNIISGGILGLRG